MTEYSKQTGLGQGVASTTKRDSRRKLPLRPIYRPEIDGLRALAVMAVIINHIEPGILPSGFLGVDIFFVISGFVVTSSLARKADSSWREYLLTFYARRVKRLFPALAICVVITSIIGCLFIYNPNNSLWTGITSLVGFSNVFLLKQSTDYFSQSAELNLFTHTWSLGVEEQFYLVFPILLGILGFSRQRRQQGDRNLFLAVLGLSVVSLIGYLYLAQTNVSAAFFLMPARFWELGTGCLTFLLARRFAQNSPESIKVVIAPISTLLLMGVMFLGKDIQTMATLAAAFSTCTAIWALDSKSFLVKLLSVKWVVQIGLLSYSLYLWHWSVLVISRWTVGISAWTIPLQLLLIVGLATASYYLIEKPLRHSQWSSSKIKTIGYGLSTSFASMLLLVGLDTPLSSKLYTGNLAAQETVKDAFSDSKTIASASISLKDCYFAMREPRNDEKVTNLDQRCLAQGAEPQPGIYVYGDSHAPALGQLLDTLHKKDKVSIGIAAKGATPFPYLNYGDGRGYQTAPHRYLSKVLQQKILENTQRGDVVVLASHLTYYFTAGEAKLTTVEKNRGLYYLSPDGNSTISLEQALDTWIIKVSDLASLLASKGASVIVLAPPPEFDWISDRNFDPLMCTGEWFKPLPPQLCAGATQDKRHLLQRRQHIVTALNDAAQRHKNLFIYDPFETLCPDADICSTHLSDGLMLFRDDNHLSKQGAEYLYDDFVRFLEEYSLL